MVGVVPVLVWGWGVPGLRGEGPTLLMASLGLCCDICRSLEHGGSCREPPLVTCGCHMVNAEVPSAAGQGSETASEALSSLLAMSQPLAVPAGKPCPWAAPSSLLLDLSWHFAALSWGSEVSCWEVADCNIRKT